MTKEERLKAFQMRLDGETWADIGKTLGYAHNTVQQDLKMVVCGEPWNVNCVYPSIKKIIIRDYGGSIAAFSRACGISNTSLYYTLTGRGKPSYRTALAIMATTGLTYTEAFGVIEK